MNSRERRKVAAHFHNEKRDARIANDTRRREELLKKIEATGGRISVPLAVYLGMDGGRL